MFSSLVQAASFFPEGLLRSVKYLSVPKANVKIQMFLGTSVPCLCSYACVERPICYTFSWDWSMDRNETPARDSNHEVPCGEKCWFLAWKRLWPNSGAFELGHQFQELTSLIFFDGPNDGIFYGSFQKWLVHISSLHRSSSRFRSISGGYDWAGAADALRPLGEAGRDGDGAPISTSIILI